MNIKLIITAAAASALMAGAAYAQSATVISPTVQPGPGMPQDPTNPAVSSTRATMPGANTTVDDTSKAGLRAKDKMAGVTEDSSMSSSSMSSSTMSAPAPPASTGYAAPTAATTSDPAPSSVSMTTSTVTNGPVPDTAENRAKYGQPMSHAGKRTAPAGN